MTTESILSTLLAAAAFLKHSVQEVAGQAVKDAYEAAKSYLQKKLSPNPEAIRALDMATDKPESLLRKALLAEETAGCELERDAELGRLVETLAALLPPSAIPAGQTVSVGGRGNRVQVAGRDLVLAERVVRRNTITPDERHITVEQRDQLGGVIRELAGRLGAADGRGGLAAVHALLQRRFKVASYLLLPGEEFDAALDFLKQQRAILRSRLRHRNPMAYQNDLYRAVFAGARELGWDGGQVYQFAADKLGLSRPVASLKELSAGQLSLLARLISREVRTQRKRAPVAPAAVGP